MIEVTTIPILIKAVDFLFDECKNILQERRNRRQNEESESNDINAEMGEAKSSVDKNKIDTKNNALVTLVRESKWKEMEDEIKRLMGLLEIHKKNLNHFRMQYAQYGNIDAPLRLIHSIESEELEILKTSKELEEALSKVYDAEIIALGDAE